MNKIITVILYLMLISADGLKAAIRRADFHSGDKCARINKKKFLANICCTSLCFLSLFCDSYFNLIINNEL